MAEYSGNQCVIKISGAPTAMVGEATTSVAGDLIYTITDVSKQVLDRTSVIKVHKQSTSFVAEADTTTTTIKATGHGLVVGDLVCNTTRSNAYRLVLTKTTNDFTISAITGQVATDTIMCYPTEAVSNYVLNRLNGTVTYATAATRVIKISGNYLPMATAAYAHDFSDKQQCDIHDVTPFGVDSKQRIRGLKFASGSLKQFDVTDMTYKNALTADIPVVYERRVFSAEEPSRFWVMLENSEVTAAIDGVADESVTWISHDEWLRLGA
jgi:hypothetical protein